MGSAQDLVNDINALINGGVMLQDLIRQKDTRIADLLAQLASLSQPPPPPPVITPPPPTSTVQVGVPYTWVMPCSEEKITFTPKNVIIGKVFRDIDTALLANSPHFWDQTVFVGCSFYAGRYALWMDHQNDVVFEDPVFEDNVATTAGDESTVRIEDCNRIFFSHPIINAHGPKHGFRVHGTSDRVCMEKATIVCEGNGSMIGRYLGGPPALVSNMELKNIQLRAAGPDPFDPKRDGSVTGLRIQNMDIRSNVKVAESINASHPTDWTLALLTDSPL